MGFKVVTFYTLCVTDDPPPFAPAIEPLIVFTSSFGWFGDAKFNDPRPLVDNAKHFALN